MEEKVRIDKWMWAVRLFKTRSLAAEECGKNHIMINGQPVKASKEVKVGDVVQIRRAPIIYHYLVKQITSKRMSAQLAVGFVEDVTPIEQLELLAATKQYGFELRDRGVGRPTKRDRRMIEKFKTSED